MQNQNTANYSSAVLAGMALGVGALLFFDKQLQNRYKEMFNEKVDDLKSNGQDLSDKVEKTQTKARRKIANKLDKAEKMIRE